MFKFQEFKNLLEGHDIQYEMRINSLFMDIEFGENFVTVRVSFKNREEIDIMLIYDESYRADLELTDIMAIAAVINYIQDNEEFFKDLLI